MDDRLFCLPACSCMTLQSESGRRYWLRTCDMENDLWKEGAHCAYFSPGDLLNTEGGIPVETEYGFMGLTYDSRSTWILDGMNEAGLAGGLLMLKEGTSVPAAAQGEGCMGMELVARLLAACKNAEEVKEKAASMQILDIPYGEGRVSATMHYFFVDPDGNEVILEAADPLRPGRLTCYGREEGIGVMTNSPVFPQQMERLKEFLTASPQWERGRRNGITEELSWDGRRLSAEIQEKIKGGKTFDGKLPGDYSSGSRFLRLAILKALNDSGNRFSDEEMLAQGSILMGSVLEPYHGGVLYNEGGGQAGSCTRYLVMYDLTGRQMYLKKRQEANWNCIMLERGCIS